MAYFKDLSLIELTGGFNKKDSLKSRFFNVQIEILAVSLVEKRQNV